ncbi:MAG: zf-HC2 domain-containing protein [Capsulimonadales bacterium]|nr:zf-HC2 domain-containing protein [Capsulimonadales bacterium]
MKRIGRWFEADDCVRYEQDLLLYLHDALPLRARGRVQNHLRHCAVCRARLETFQTTSAALAFAVRGPEMPSWQPAGRSAGFRNRELPWYLPLLVLIGVGGVGWGVFRTTETRADHGVGKNASVAYGGTNAQDGGIWPCPEHAEERTADTTPKTAPKETVVKGKTPKITVPPGNCLKSDE